ncbi:hypothetical protein D3C78_1186860 [compost metagenome]
MTDGITPGTLELLQAWPADYELTEQCTVPMREPFQGLRIILLKRVNEPINKAAFVFYQQSALLD